MISIFSTMPTSGEPLAFSDGLTGQGSAVRSQLVSQNVKVRDGSWHTLSLSVEAYPLEVVRDGERLIQTRNAGFTRAGNLGAWTKADFTEFKIIPSDEQMPAGEGQNEPN